jgi:hypothetical protein
LAVWVALRERGLILRLSVSALFVFGLFFCHLFALGVYGLGLLAFETHRVWSRYAGLRRTAGRNAALRTLPKYLLDFVLTGLPFLLVLPLLMMSPTRGLWDFYWELNGKISGFIFVVDLYSDDAAALLLAAVICAAGWALWNRALSFHRFGLALLAIGALIYMALPRVMFDTYLVDQRLPISLAFILVACLDADLRNRAVRWVFASGLVLLVGIRVAEVESTWRPLSAGVESFRQSVQLLHRGAKVVVAYADPNGGDRLRDYGLVHADCIAIIERSALVTTAFTVVGKQVLHARPPYRDRVDTEDGTPPMIGDMVSVANRENTSDDYWSRWTTDYDYLYVLFTDPDFQNPDPEHLTEIYAGDRFMLYRIERSQLTAASRPLKEHLLK